VRYEDEWERREKERFLNTKGNLVLDRLRCMFTGLCS